jgi:hypothetical protein
MSPSPDEIANLKVMTDLLSNNPAAASFVRSLWVCFGYRIRCIIRDDDGQPSSHHIVGIHSPHDVGTISIEITVRRTARVAEALVHELLHARLIADGYPVFWIDEEQESEKWNLARGIINNSEHVVMRPLYLSFGFDLDRFLGPSRPLRPEHKRIAEWLEAAEPILSSSRGFLRVVSAELCAQNISFTPLEILRHVG